MKTEVIEYINTKLSHEDCLTCIAILEKNVESILTCTIESVRKGKAAVPKLLKLLCNKYALHQACAASKKFEDYAINSP